MEQYKTNGYGTLSTQIFYQVSDDRYLSQCRIYMRNVHVNSGICVLIICPARDVLPENRKKWPMVLALADETLIIYSLIRNRPHNPVQEYVVEKTASGRTAHSFPEELGVPGFSLLFVRIVMFQTKILQNGSMKETRALCVRNIGRSK